ncbi:hypothetical protein ABL78_4858 [Leptomonas seymouri]|uniref:Peroxin 19 n=1 Tax=Leptomonas seymouri TaxID=5684 RepID=A0A0N0P5K6_LEPSE|nr:hypothetical protein ABL78_4858 [Leptomonas seymouri]|eukprot:KPI86097.1 hypothetical protein ABL78_4858 [Leptomonas seymouri]
MSDDDLDALLDEAMDMVDEQERKHEEEVRVRDAKLENDLQTALDEASGAGGANGDIAKLFMSMLGGADGNGGDPAGLESFKKNVMAMVSSLEGEENLGEEDKANLERVKELMHVMEEEDIDKASEVLDRMKNDGVLPEGDDIEDAEVGEASRRCMEMLQQISQAADGAAAPSTAPAAPASSPSAAAQGGLDSVPENVASVLLATLMSPEFVEPIRVMRDAYGPYMAAHGSEVTESERERYDRQRAKAEEICTFLEVPITGESDPRLVPLLELMHQFSELGEPPANLADYAPKRTAASAKGGDE